MIIHWIIMLIIGAWVIKNLLISFFSLNFLLFKKEKINSLMLFPCFFCRYSVYLSGCPWKPSFHLSLHRGKCSMSGCLRSIKNFRFVRVCSGRFGCTFELGFNLGQNKNFKNFFKKKMMKPRPIILGGLVERTEMWWGRAQ